MKAIRNLLIAIIVYALVIVITGKLLVTARTSLPFVVGSFIDALVSIGILFNFIVLLLFSTRLMTAPRAVVTSAVSTVVLITVALTLIAMRVPADARPGGITVLTLSASFLIWFALHWLWAKRRIPAEPAT